MSATPLALHEATVRQHCKGLHLPTVAEQCGPRAAASGWAGRVRGQRVSPGATR